MNSKPKPDFQITDCNDLNQIQAIVAYHRISQSSYDAMINAFFHSAPPPEKRIHASEIRALVDKANCEDYLRIEGNSPTTNEDIMLSIEPAFISYYIVALFKGVLKWYEPDEFYFSKAIGASHITHVFRVVKNGDTVYLADYSDTIPPLA